MQHSIISAVRSGIRISAPHLLQFMRFIPEDLNQNVSRHRLVKKLARFRWGVNPVRRHHFRIKSFELTL